VSASASTVLGAPRSGSPRQQAALPAQCLPDAYNATLGAHACRGSPPHALPRQSHSSTPARCRPGTLCRAATTEGNIAEHCRRVMSHGCCRHCITAPDGAHSCRCCCCCCRCSGVLYLAGGGIKHRCCDLGLVALEYLQKLDVVRVVELAGRPLPTPTATPCRPCGEKRGSNS
jgi:hypothetical protein